MQVSIRGLLYLLISFVLMAPSDAQSLDNKPNIIYILADDLGYGDLSCYGQQKFETPNIDRLAAEGMMFTQHYSGSTVCAPSRSSLLTGLHTGHTPIRGNKELKTEGQLPLPDSSITIAELLKSAGYATGAFGKWGLGFVGTEGDPNNQGFDVFYGYNCQRMAHRYYPPYLWHNQDSVLLEGNDWKQTVTYAPDEIQKATLAFIDQHKSMPFFAYVPFVLPHAELISPNDSLFAKFDGVFEEHRPYMPDNNYASDYGINIVPKKYCSQIKPNATFASMVVRLDVYVGQIIDKLEELGIADNTIVMFASDNGPHRAGGANPDFFNSNGSLRGLKCDLYEGGIRVPFIVRWPNVVEAGLVSHHVSAFWDLTPTLADISQSSLPIQTDGVSFLPTLTGKGNQKKHDSLYWEYNIKGGNIAVRKGKWKGIILNVKGNTQMELYDIVSDQAEHNDIAAEYPEIVEQVKNIIAKEHMHSDLFPIHISE